MFTCCPPTPVVECDTVDADEKTILPDLTAPTPPARLVWRVKHFDSTGETIFYRERVAAGCASAIPELPMPPPA